jgi:hypothetical protein
MKLLAVMAMLPISLSIMAQQLKERKPGSPLEHLPPNIEVLTHFGERADFSPDNKTIAFMTKSFGDAMSIDLKTRDIRCLTCGVPGAAFLRVMHISTGDYILIGPDHFENINISRTRDNELWFLSKERGSKPVKLGHKMCEGMAISKKTLKVAFSQIDLTGGSPKLKNEKVVYESRDKNCVIEAQDFYDNDSKMTFICYEPNGLASVMGIDLQTLEVTNFSKKPGTYNECEGIFPDGKYTLVEGDRQCDWLGGKRGGSNIDIWKLRLDGTGKDFVRLTNFNDFEGGKASNPVVSTDGRYMSFQSAKTTDPAGVGYCLLLYKFK